MAASRKKINKKKRKLAIAMAVYITTVRRTRKRSKRWENRTHWVKPWVGRRPTHGVFNNLLNELTAEDHGDYRSYMRMSPQSFNELLAIVGPAIAKQDTRYRQAIRPSQRLAITLRFLATGESYHSLRFSYRVGRSTISDIVNETCLALFDCMKAVYLKMPDTEENWKEIATEFESKWNYPFCIGALDGKHIRIKNPTNAGSQYYNYKNYYSVILLAMVDANYKFIYACAGAPGRNGDAGVYGDSTLKTGLTNNLLNLPPSGTLRGSTDKCNYHIVGDDAFPLGLNMMKPYPHKNLDRDVVVFNYRFSRARRVVENAFGILASRFRVFQTQIELEPKIVNGLVMASCCVHNFLVEKHAPQYISNLVDSDGNREAGTPMLTGINRTKSRNYRLDAKSQRESLRKYFVSAEGSVPWQSKVVDNKIAAASE